jgi:hypothetical protein
VRGGGGGGVLSISVPATKQSRYKTEFVFVLFVFTAVSVQRINFTACHTRIPQLVLGVCVTNKANKKGECERFAVGIQKVNRNECRCRKSNAILRKKKQKWRAKQMTKRVAIGA